MDSTCVAGRLLDALRVEGWLNVYEVDVPLEKGRFFRPIWEPHFCVLSAERRRYTHHRNEKAAASEEQAQSEPCFRLDGGKAAFDKRWGYGALESINEHSASSDWSFGELRAARDSSTADDGSIASLDVFGRSQTLDDRKTPPNSSYDKGGLGERRGSVPVVSSGMTDDTMDGPSTPSRFANFFSRKPTKSNLKRTKSVTKLDRKRSAGNNDLEGGATKLSSLKRTMSLGRLTRRWTPKTRDGSPPPPDKRPQELTQGALMSHRLRTSRSHESLLQTHSAMHSIDLAEADVEIKPLHSSILGQDHCFQVSTTHGSKFYSCRTAQERQQWIQCLRKSVHPKQEQTMRTDNSLKLWVIEAKNCTAKKRYFCEVCLDKTLYARTSSKQKNDLLFWGEHFEFCNLPDIKTVTVNFYREADKKKKKEKNQLMGYINIPIKDINNRQLVEKWYIASSGVVGKSGRENKQDLPSLRIKVRYQSISILPMQHYQALLVYLNNNYASLVETLEPLVSVKAKEEIATSLVHVLQASGAATEFLSDIVMQEVDKLDNENLTFRGNSIATKAMEAYMKLIGGKYLHDTLGELIRTILECTEDCEVDPSRVPNNAVLLKQQQNLQRYCEMAWFKIINSHSIFPSELSAVFTSLKERCEEAKRPGDICDNLISACIFLRFLCPAILSPSLFNLTQEFPQAMHARNLTLIAKTIQNVANFTKFGAKEEYMNFMNNFVERELDSMHRFLKQISTVGVESIACDFNGYIDSGKELSLLHMLLNESLSKLPDESVRQKLAPLVHILEDISAIHDDPEMIQRKPSTPMRIYDNLNNGNENGGSMPVLDGSLKRPVNNMDTTRSLDRATMPLTPSDRGRRTSLLRAMGNSDSADDYVLLTSLNSRSPPPRLSASQRSLSAARPDETQVANQWRRMVSAAEMVNGDYVDLVSFMDEFSEEARMARSMSTAPTDGDSCSQLSLGQLSTVASSGYQSFGYSASSSPIDSASVSTEQFTPVTQPLSFSNPLFHHQGSGQQTARITDGPTRIRSSSSLSSEDDSSSPQLLSSQTSAIDTPPSPPPRRSSHSHSLLDDSDRSLPRRTLAHPHQRPVEHKRSPSSSSCDSLSQSTPRPRCLSSSSTNSLRNPVVGQSHSVSAMTTSLVTPPSPHPSPRPLTLSQLSRSSEFPLPNRHPPSPQPLKRTATDTAIMDSLMHSDHAYAVPAPPRRIASQNTVRMGVSSMQRLQAQENEKTKTEYEQELTLLRQQLAETQAMLAETQERLISSQSGPADEQVWLDKLQENEESLRREQQAKDDHMKAIIHRLVTVEERLRREQTELQVTLDQKQAVIDAQERRLVTMDAANTRLLVALNQLKERHVVQMHQNGVGSPATAKLSLATENGQFKSSSC